MIEVTDSSQRNWRRAIEMCADARDGWTLFDTTTGPNEQPFDSAVRDVVTRHSNIRYYRIMCFSPDGSGELIQGLNSPVQAYFRAQIDPSADGAPGGGSAYDWLRRAIADGKFHLLHLPFPVPMDYFVAAGEEQKECILGFADKPEVLEAGLSYSSGIMSRRLDLSGALAKHFESVLLPAAQRHMREQLTARTCICAPYCTPDDSTTLWPKATYAPKP